MQEDPRGDHPEHRVRRPPGEQQVAQHQGGNQDGQGGQGRALGLLPEAVAEEADARARQGRAQDGELVDALDHQLAFGVGEPGIGRQGAGFLAEDTDLDDVLSYYMGKNTQSRQEFIIDNLRVEKDEVEDEKEVAVAAVEGAAA